MTPSKVIQFTSFVVNNYHASNFLAPLLLFMCPRKRNHGDLDYFCNTSVILQSNILFAVFLIIYASVVKNFPVKGMQLIIVTLYTYIYSFKI